MTMNFVPHFDLVRENHETELFSPWPEGLGSEFGHLLVLAAV